MFLDNNIPIIINKPNWEYADIYFIHDMHYGSAQFDYKKYQRLKYEILENDRALVMFVGDLMENAIPTSKSDMFTQTANPAEQKEYITEQLSDFNNKVAAVVPGNHCYNRSTKTAGLYPLYDCCLLAGIGDKYRDIYAFIDIGVGRQRKAKNKQYRYVGQIQHKAKDIKSVCTADYTDGIDFFTYGHDHEPKDRPRAKLVYDCHNKYVTKRNIEIVNCGSFCDYGGYGAQGAYRPQSDKMYMLRLDGKQRSIETRGFY